MTKRKLYTKIDVHPDKIPAGFWDVGTRVCSQCKQEWPNFQIFEPSACCDAPTVAYPDRHPKNEDDECYTWRQVCKKFLTCRFERYYAELTDLRHEREATEAAQSLGDEIPDVPVATSCEL